MIACLSLMVAASLPLTSPQAAPQPQSTAGAPSAVSTPAHVASPNVTGGGSQLNGSACPGQVLYLSTSTGTIYSVADYGSNPVATLVVDTGLNGITDIAVDPVTGKMYGIDFLGTTNGMEVTEIDLSTGATTLIGSLPAFTNSLDFGTDGFMYARDELGETYRITLAPFSATLVNSFIGLPTAGDVAWDVDGTLLLTTTTGFIERFDLVTGGTLLFDTFLQNFAFGIEVDCDGTVYIATNLGDWYTADMTAGTLSQIGNLGIAEQVYGIAFAESPGGIGPIGTTYCSPAVPNSSGAPGVISANGSTQVSLNNFELVASSLPTASFGFFLASTVQGMTMNPGGSQGTLCLSGAIGRYVGPGQIQNTQGTGEFQLAIDLTLVPQPSGFVQVMAGETWNFQAWHRDSVAGMATSNFTDAVSVSFQ